MKKLTKKEIEKKEKDKKDARDFKIIYGTGIIAIVLLAIATILNLIIKFVKIK